MKPRMQRNHKEPSNMRTRIGCDANDPTPAVQAASRAPGQDPDIMGKNIMRTLSKPSRITALSPMSASTCWAAVKGHTFNHHHRLSVGQAGPSLWNRFPSSGSSLGGPPSRSSPRTPPRTPAMVSTALGLRGLCTKYRRSIIRLSSL